MPSPLSPRLALGLLLAASTCSPTTDAGPYEPCNAAVACTGELECRTPVMLGVVTAGTLCTQRCAQSSDCPLATTGGVARVCVAPPGTAGGTCLTYCATDVDCLPGTLCRITRLTTGEGTRVCVP